jgi:hypothetical protein
MANFRSILFDDEEVSLQSTGQPAFFGDLNLDQLVDAIVAPKQDYELKPFFYSLPQRLETIFYRHEVMHDLENETVMAAVCAFAEQMIIARRYLRLVEKLYEQHHKRGWFLEAALVYCNAVLDLLQKLEQVPFAGRGWLAFMEYLRTYVASPEFQALLNDGRAARQALDEVSYCLILHNNGTVRVRRHEDESDYSVDVTRTFARFQQGAVKDYTLNLQYSGMNHIEAQILELVVRLFPQPFAVLERFCQQHAAFMDPCIETFDREVQFYVAYLQFIADLRQKGLPFCYPEITQQRGDLFVEQSFDLALAYQLLYRSTPTICNDFSLQGVERILVVTGPNQGGKTTFARMFGQLHYLARLGCLVPGQRARLFFFDQLFTHFEREEDMRNLRGKLQDDLLRIHEIVTQATPNSLIILNEIFSSTTLKDALFLSQEIMRRVSELDLQGVWVTFMDELATFNEKMVSMLSTVDPENPAERTFRILRRPADGLAYALSLAEKHRLTYRQIQERIKP